MVLLNSESSDISLENQSYYWFISSDSIFTSDFKGLEKFALIENVEYSFSRYSLYDGKKISDNSIYATEVTVSMMAGAHCAQLMAQLANKSPISKITIQKIILKTNKMEVIEEHIFTQCVLQLFRNSGKNIEFSFKYTSISDKYIEFKKDGVKKGSAAAKLDLIKWEAK